MKNIEKLAVALVLGFIVQAASMPALFVWMTKHYQGEHISLAAEVLGYLSGVGHWIVRIVCGVWLFTEARREKQSKWIWCLFGLFVQVQAVAIFFLYTILHEMRSKGTAKKVDTIN